MIRIPSQRLRCIALALAATSSNVNAEVLLHTDTSWEVTTATAGAGWNSDAAFDASAWQSATTLYNVSTYLGSAYSAHGIWSAGGQFSTTETAIWARRVWQLDALPLSAALTGGFDDDGSLWINGTLVISNYDGFAGPIGAPDLLPYLKVGDNVIAFAVTDNYRVWGYNHAAWAQIDGQAGIAAVPEPATAALMLAGLAATSCAKRRRRPPPPPLAPIPHSAA